MYKPIFYKNYSLAQAFGKYLIFDKFGKEVSRGFANEYIDETRMSELVEELLKDKSKSGSFNSGLGCFTSCSFE